ncbi:MAG: thermonuclease family protein [Planctomycetota bacterium]
MTTPILALLLALLAAPSPAPIPAPFLAATPQEVVAPAQVTSAAVPTELFDVVYVVDGDTLHIQRNGEKQKLRLLSVDTEEKLSNRKNISPSKPETVFGQETMLWAQEFFGNLASDDAPAQVGLLFPDGKEERDVYGRILCHVILPDGTDFNLELVRGGWSPYFNKYGNSRICHEAFVEAQRAAQAANLGIWNPATNRAATPGTPSAERQYDRLLPWWQARAEAIDTFRSWQSKAPRDVIASEDADELEAALARCQADPNLRVTVFATLEGRAWEEDRGGLTLLLRPGDSRNTQRAVRAFLSNAKARTAINDAIGIESRGEDFVQNYFFLTGRIEAGPHGMLIQADDPAQWRLAGPELPSSPVEAAGTR